MSVKKRAAIVLAAVILMAALVYTRPMALSQICGGIDVSQSHYVHGYYVDSPRMAEDARFEIKADDERLTQI
ncbi:MAG: hypothetical protein IKA58_01365, partial [Clostridia bacterium]|nr:hypothetical protein [Clostridia bacterium]